MRKNFASSNMKEGKKVSFCSEIMQDLKDDSEYKMTDIERHHRSKCEKLSLPEWIRNIKCPKCGDIISPEGFRSVELKLNAKNFGDICIEFMCIKCSMVDRFYYKENIDSVQKLISYLKGEKEPMEKPLNEWDMHNDKRNNISDQWFLSTKKEQHDPI